MIAYLESKDTNVEVPDDIGQNELKDIQDNFHSYLESPKPINQPENVPRGTFQPETTQLEPQKWVPNFYESHLKPFFHALNNPQEFAPETPAGQVFGLKAVEAATFGLAKPLLEPFIQPIEKDHPVATWSGEAVGGLGSLLATGGALEIAGLGAKAVEIGQAATKFIPEGEVGAKIAASAVNWLPKAIMTGSTFGTQTFIAKTIKMFQDGNVDLPTFGRDVLRPTASSLAFGGALGAIGRLTNIPASVASAAGLGFINSKLEGADNKESSLNAAIWAAFEFIGSEAKTPELIQDTIKSTGDSIGDYVASKDPSVDPETAKKMGKAFVDNEINKHGGIEKMGDKETALQTLEDINQKIRQGKVPAIIPTVEKPAEITQAIPTTEATMEAPPTAPTEPEELPKTPIESAIQKGKEISKVVADLVKGGMKDIPQAIEDVKNIITPPTPVDKQAELIKSFSELAKMPEEQVPEDLKDVYHFMKLGTEKKSLIKNIAQISDRLDSFGLNDAEKKLIAEAYGLNKANVFGQPSIGKTEQDLIHAPIEEQESQISSALAQQRGLEQPDEKTLEDSRKIVDLIHDSLNPKTSEVSKFAQENKGKSENDIAQMAHDRGLLEESSEDLLKVELSKAEKQKDIFKPRPEVSRQPSIKSEPKEISETLKDLAEEIKNIVSPSSAAPLTASNLREQLGRMARSYDKAEASLENASKLFSKQSAEKNTDFINRMELGQEQETKELNDIAQQLRKLLDFKRREVKALGTGKLENFIANYFPHIWDQGEQGVSSAIQKAAKRPFEGAKSFLKKRTIEFFKEGIEAGLTPVSFNPVDLTLLKIREMDKYIMAHRTLNVEKEEGRAQYVAVGKDHPEGWVKIDDRISTIFKSPMIAVKEAFDEKMMESLNAVAKSLGIDLERGMKAKGEGKKYGNVWGLSQSGPQETVSARAPGKIWTRFAGPESALAHELGHQLDDIYGLKDMFLSNPTISGELTNLANERLRDNGIGGTKYDEKFVKYIQKPEEKMAVMLESYIHAPELLKEFAPTTYEKLVNFLNSRSKLKPLTEIKPSLVMGVGESEVYAGGSVIAGHIWAQPDSARIINNYLSPGLQKSALYRAFRFAGNALNQFQLSFSAFHLGFTSVEAVTSKIALALNQIFSGHPIKAVETALSAPFAPVTNIIQGNQLFKAWRGEGKSPMDEVMANAMASAGGRAQMDQFYATKSFDQMKKLFQAGKPIQGILRLPLSIVEASSKPILEYIVPRQKLGVLADILKMEMENNPDMTHEEMRAIAQRAWDSVDNRMGQLVHDNLFWNRTFKDLLMASVRSVGWNLGTIRELTGGAKDIGQMGIDLTKGKKTNLSYRAAYTMALPIVAGLLGAIYQYLRTGKGPEELKDYYFPKTSGLDANGDPNRVALPTYMKDVYHYGQEPFKTVANKLNPLLAIMAQMLNNKDYYGVKIRNQDDPIVKQMLSEVIYVAKQLEPFGFRNMQKQTQSGNRSLTDVIQPWIGITPAPWDINQTKAEKLAHEIAASKVAIGGRTQEQADRSTLIRQLTNEFRLGNPDANNHLLQAYQEGKISSRQMHSVIITSRMTPLQHQVHNFTYDEIKAVYDKANPDEKQQLERMLRKKEESSTRGFVRQE